MPGPAQTPIVLANAGEYAQFSDKCVQLLIEAGYNPADFGSYSHVAKRIRAAKAKVKAWKDKTPGPDGKPPLKPNPYEEWLAKCESGHLHQNAVFQTKRGDDCTNTKPGLYDMEMAPCMPQWGKSTDPCTEHYHVTRKERAAGKKRKEEAEKKGKPGVYEGATADKDADQRANELGDEKADKKKDDEKVKKTKTSKQEERKAKQTGDKGRTAKAKGAAALKAQAAADKKAKKPSVGKKGGVDGDTAEECINNWRKAAFKQMREKIIKERDENRKKADQNEKDGTTAAAKKREKDAKDALEAHRAKFKDKKLSKKEKKKRKELENEAKSAEEARKKATNPGCLADAADAWIKKHGKKGGPTGKTPDGTFPGGDKGSDTGSGKKQKKKAG